MTQKDTHHTTQTPNEWHQSLQPFFPTPERVNAKESVNHHRSSGLDYARMGVGSWKAADHISFAVVHPGSQSLLFALPKRPLMIVIEPLVRFCGYRFPPRDHHEMVSRHSMWHRRRTNHPYAGRMNVISSPLENFYHLFYSPSGSY